MVLDQALKRFLWKRWHFRLSLRVLLVLILVLGAWLGWVVNRAGTQREAVAAIRRSGGSVTYDRLTAEFRPRTPSDEVRLVRPEWLIKTLGPDYFDHVIEAHVSVGGPRAKLPGNVLLEQVGRLGHLKGLALYGGNSWTDADLAHLVGLTGLRWLVMDQIKIQGRGLAVLEKLNGLEFLTLSNVAITDADLVHLGRIRSLKHLVLSKPNITDAGMVHLAGLTNLEHFELDESPITSTGLARLQGNHRLEELFLKSTRIESVEPLKHLTGIKRLVLTGTPITDSGLTSLEGLKSLRHLNLQQTLVTNEGLVQLRRLLPLVFIVR